MTVITKPLSQQEKEKKKDETPMEEVSLKRVDVEAPPAARISVITASARPNTGKSSHLCLVVSVMLATALALSVLGYYQLNRGHHFARYRGSCRLPCHMRRQQVCPMNSRLRDGGQRQTQEGVIVMGNLGEWKDRNNEPEPLIREDIEVDHDTIISDMKTGETMDGEETFEYTFEMDMEHETYELIQMPEISTGLYLHDFIFNRTAIIEKNRCFAMLLDRNEIAPPRSLRDLIERTGKDGFELDLDEVEKEMMVIEPALTNEEVYKQNGAIISSACSGKTTYSLEPVPEHVVEDIQEIEDAKEDVQDAIQGIDDGLLDNFDVDFDATRKKRSAESPKKMFQEINKKFIKINIVNYAGIFGYP